MVKGPDGSFYGVSNTANGYGQGYRLTPAGQFAVVYRFLGGDDGKNPSDLIVGSDGNFYGTASGGPSNNGLLFRLTAGGHSRSCTISLRSSTAAARAASSRPATARSSARPAAAAR